MTAAPLRMYSSQTRSARWAGALAAAGIGECCGRGELPPRRWPWFYDSGAYADLRAGRVFDETRYDRDVRIMGRWAEAARETSGPLQLVPDFIVLPDVVGLAAASLARTEHFLLGPGQPIGGYPAIPLFVAVQDGMTSGDVAGILRHPGVRGIFVGGSLSWKMTSGAYWTAYARDLGLRCHIGRAASLDRLAWAKRIGADSVDGNAPNWSEAGLRRAAEALRKLGPVSAAAPIRLRFRRKFDSM